MRKAGQEQFNRFGRAFIGAAFCAMTTQMAAAVESESDGTTALAEVVVTAERRESTVQKSSLAIQVVDAEQLRRSGVTQASDLTNVLPGLQIAPYGALTQAYVRGVGDAAGNPTATSPVAFNIDGVYIARQEAIGFNFFDLERVEALKGPQGTLYGRNASGGAVNIITRRPSLDETGGYANLEVGNYDLVHLESAINLPVSSTFALRAAVNIVRRDGYLSDGTDDDKQTAGRIRGLWQPSDAVSLLFTVDAAHIGGRGAGFTYSPQRPGSDPWEGVLSGAAQAYIGTFNPIVPRTAPVGTDNDYWNASIELNADVGFAELTVLPAFRHTRYEAVNYSGFVIGQQANSDESTFEVRLAKASERVKWVAGLYYFKEREDAHTAVDASVYIEDIDIAFHPNTESYAGFGQATFSVTDALRLIGGLRYTSDKRELTGSTTNLPTDAVTPFSGAKTFGKTTWKAGVEYDLAPQHMLYATVATGFKSGGINQEPAPNTYKPESLTAFELGSRNRFFDNRLQANMELFYWKYRDQQNTVITFDNTFLINLIVLNAGQATMKGGNLDLVFRATDADTLRLFGEFNDSEYSHFAYTTADTIYGSPIFNPASTGCALGAPTQGPIPPSTVREVDCTGMPLPRAPRFIGSAGWDHVIPLSYGSLQFGADLQFASSRYLTFNFTPAVHADAYRTLNVNVGYSAPANKWSVGAFVRNVTDETQYTGGFDTIYSSPLTAVAVNPPRTFGARAGVKF